MAPNMADGGAFDTTVLRTLQAEKHRELLDIIDSLRAQGLNDHVDLPQLIVCGDQSSGKSSVLAAISGVPFPKRDNLCTRFATEVNLRRNDALDESQITVTIMPSTSRAPADRQTLDAFRHELKSMRQLPDVIEEASNAMGLGSLNAAFSADVLRLEVRGPFLPQLTIVDLPGLVHSENKHQSEEDIRLVTELVDDYMRQERSIILAVVSAKNDYANQIVLTKARKVDPEGQRTLGIITKPDTLSQRSAGEDSFIALAKNQDIQFTLGWHVVRNRDTNESVTVDRDAQEEAFFKTTEWRTLDHSQRGIHTLRGRLSLVLFQQIRKELPGLISEIAAAVQSTSTELSRMGPSRSTHAEKRIFLVEVGQRFREICQAACDGQYDDAFFGESDDPSSNGNRLRAIVQNLNIEFARKMAQAAPRYAFRSSSTKNASSSRLPVLDRATELISSHRGKELPGTFNPLLIGELFRELSSPWKKQTEDHTERLWVIARRSVVAMLTYITDEHVRDSCLKMIIDPQLEQVRENLTGRLHDYLREYRRQPITYNHYLTENVQNAKMERSRELALQNLNSLFSRWGSLSSSNAEAIVKAIFDDRKPNMDDVAAESLADYTEAYYKVALKRVTDEVPAHVVEPAIMLPLPTLLDPSTILKMPEESIDLIGGESEERMKHRESLRAKVEVLKRSNMICQVYAERVGDETNMTPSPQPTKVVEEEQEITEEIGGSGAEISRSQSESDEVLVVSTPYKPVAEDISTVEFGVPAVEDTTAQDAEDDRWGRPSKKKSDKKKKRSAFEYAQAE